MFDLSLMLKQVEFEDSIGSYLKNLQYKKMYLINVSLHSKD